MLDDAARTTGKTSATEPSNPLSSSALSLPDTDSFAAATPGDTGAPALKN
jgi:hypothetical protein